MESLLTAIVLISFCVLAVCSADAASPPPHRILLLGDSILDCLKGDHRVEVAMLERLRSLDPDRVFEIQNMARGGMWIGPADVGDVVGTSTPLFESESAGWYFTVRDRRPDADTIVILFGANDSKVYPPETFGEKLSSLCDRLRTDFPDARIILATGMYQDPEHEIGYTREPSMVARFKQGDSRNIYLRPYFEQTRGLARKRSYGLADVCERIREETASGNWDLRVRQDGTLDASRDGAHLGDEAWYNNIHPNPRGAAVIADELVKTVLNAPH